MIFENMFEFHTSILNAAMAKSKPNFLQKNAFNSSIVMPLSCDLMEDNEDGLHRVVQQDRLCLIA